LCWRCTDRATDAHGRKLTFHISSTSNFEARFKSDGALAGEVTKSHNAYVGALKVWADEAHMGGIVLTPYREKNHPQGKCPVCHTSVRLNPRYPDYLCQWCCEKAVDAQGRPITFHVPRNFEARFKHDGSPAPVVTESHTAYVGFLKVWAEEAHFGGIVVTPYRERRH
jgi:hypothetical protein